MQYRVSGTIGDLVVDLVIDAPSVARTKSRKSVSHVTGEELEAQVAFAKSTIGERLASQGSLMVDLLARQNKGGTMALSRAYREVWLPLQQALEGKYSRLALEHGMSVALEKGMPVAYAKAVARRWEGEAPAESVPAEPKYRVV